jgi:hypothetical protein
LPDFQKTLRPLPSPAGSFSTPKPAKDTARTSSDCRHDLDYEPDTYPD